MNAKDAVDAAFNGRLRVLRSLGAGGEAEVLLAHDDDLDADVVVKVRLVESAAELPRLRREARLLLQMVPHPLLPVVRHDVVHGDHYLLVSDHVPGTDLAAVLARQGAPGLPAATALAYLEQVAQALDHLHHAHRPSIVHGDVKPENLIVTDDGRVVLIDFGSATHRGDDGVRTGTPGFTAPEVVAGEVVTPEADVYSLAAVAVTLLSGIAPVVGGTHWEGLRAAQISGVESVLRRALSFDPLRRPTRASELVARLRQAIELDLPTGTVTLCLAVTAVDDGDRWALDTATIADGHGGRRVTTATVPHGALLFAFTHTADAARAAFAFGADDDSDGAQARDVTVGLHAGDLGGWHGTTMQQLSDELDELVRAAPRGRVVCSPPVRLLLTHAPSLRFDQHGNGLLVSRTTALTATTRTAGTDVEAWAASRSVRPLVGRPAALDDAVAMVRTGASRSSAGFRVIVGESGTGKTRVLAELATSTLANGGKVFVGRCTEHGGAYESFAGALGRGAVTARGRTGSGDEGRHEILETVLSVLTNRDRPVLLAIDDVQWIDSSSAALLEDLLDQAGPSLSVVATCASGDVPVAVEGLVNRATKSGLGPLDQRGLVQLAAATGVALDDDDAEALHTLTSGNPFYALQVLEHPADDGRQMVPPLVGARQLVQRRLAQLAPDVRTTLMTAAVLGREANVFALAGVLGVAPFDVLPQLETGTTAGLLVAGESPGEFRFSHRLVREAIADALGPTRRSLLHATIADRLGATEGDSSADEAAASHWLAAGRLGDPRRAALATLKVANASLDRLAPEQAITLLDQALTLLASQPLDDDRNRLEGRLRASRGRALLVTSRLVDARVDLFAAADLARSAHDGDTLADIALAASLQRRHGLDEPDLLRLVEIAEDECPPSSPRLRALLAVRRARLLPNGTPQERRAAIARRALEDLDRLEPIDAAQVEAEVARACWGPDDAEERERLATTHVARAEQQLSASGSSRWTGVLVEALSARVAARVQLGAIHAALADTIKAAERAEAAENRFLATRARMGEAVIAAVQGRHAAAARLAADAVAGSQRRHNLVLAELALTWAIGRDEGRQAELASLEPQLAGLVDENPMFVAAFALAHAEAGNLDDARRLVHRLGGGLWPRDWMWLACSLATLEAAVLLDERDTVRRFVALLGRYSGQWALAGAELVCLGPVDRVLGLAHVALGDAARGRTLLERSVESALAADAEPWLTRAQAALAQLVSPAS